MINRRTNKIMLFIMLILMACGLCFAQKSELKKKLKQANEYYERQDFLKAYDIYKELARDNIADFKSSYRAGQCLFYLNKRDSLTLLYFLLSSAEVTEAHYYIGRIYHINNNLYDALNEFLFLKPKYNEEMEIPMQEIEHWIGVCKRSIEQSLNKQNNLIRNLGPAVNTAFPEYAPILPNNESLLVFTSRREGSTGGEKDPYGNFFEDIYYCTKTDSGWSKASNFGNKINTKTHDATVAFTPDSNALIIYRTDIPQTGGDLYISRQKENEWKEPVLLNKKINSEFLESSACFSPDGDVIIFSSNRPGGFGGKDLYKVRKFSEEIYSLPQNLGPEINTPNDEDAPFLNSDGSVLFFSSNGHNTIGGYDIFKTEFNHNTGKCGLAVNMGVPVNSTGDDIFFILKKDNITGYLSSNRTGGYGNTDIYEVGIENSPETYMVVKGSITINTNQVADLVKLQITLTEPSGKINGIYKLKKNYNTFILVVDKKIEYKIVVEGPEIDPLVKTMKFESDEIEFTVKKKVNR